MYVDTSISNGQSTVDPDRDPDRLARFFKALSEPTRLRVVLALTDECRPVSAIAHATGLPQPLVSHHLRILRDADIARPDRRGNHVYY
jgi:DNA-binding transcriptional ArsR family regulator